MSEWQDIASMPPVNRTHQWFKCDVWAHRFELVSAATGEVRKVSRRFADVTKKLVMPPFNQMYSSALMDTVEWEGVDKSWTITHWMHLPAAPHNPEKEE